MIYFNEDIKQWIDDGEDEEETLLDDMLLDYQIFKLSMVWNSEDYIWNRWLRENN
jgi:hypothetical protein